MDLKRILCKQDSYEGTPSKSLTTQYQHHIPSGRCIYLKCSDERYFEPPHVNMGDDVAERFLDQVQAAATVCRQQLANKIPMKRLFQEKWRKYKNVTNCLICAKPFKSTDKKVYCHDHLTGEYRGPAHNARSELELPQKVKVPCIIHHLKGILFVYYSYFHSF